jgi:hypothetical protein
VSAGKSSIQILTIENANVTGTSTSSSTAGGTATYGGAGIGTGNAADGGNSRIESLSIEDANVTGTSTASGYSGCGGSGLGTGSALDTGANSGIGRLTIKDASAAGRGSSTGRSTAYTFAGSGIGTGSARWAGNSTLGGLTVEGGNITADGSNGPGIGSGSVEDDGDSSVANLEIRGGSFTFASARAGIGGGDGGSSVANLVIQSGSFDCSQVAPSGRYCLEAESITFGPGSVAAVTNTSTVASATNWASAGGTDLYFEYVSDSGEESFDASPLIHLPSLSSLPDGLYGLALFNARDGKYDRSMYFNRTRSRGCAFSVSAEGSYSISVSSEESGVCGSLETNGSPVFNATRNGDNAFELVAFVPCATPLATLSDSLAMSPTPVPEATATFPPPTPVPSTALPLTPTPEDTLGDDESWSVTVSASLTQSESATVSISCVHVPVASQVEEEIVLEDGSLTVTGSPTLTVEARCTQVISYAPIQIPVVHPSPTRVRLGIHQDEVVPQEKSNALIIGVATGAGLLVAIFAGVFVFLMRSRRRPSGDDSSDIMEKDPKYDDMSRHKPGEEQLEEELDPGFVEERKSNYETMTPYANEPAIEKDEVFI